jgi:peptide/nickel transport system substrate-binding protein
MIDWKGRFSRSWHIPSLERLNERVSAFSAGDRFLFYTGAFLLSIATLAGLYALEQSLLVRVPAYGGSVTEGSIGSPRFINPLLAISDADRDLSALTYAGLMGLSGKGELIPVLAESYVIAPDGKSYTFTLRPDAKFSDGTPVTANDVVITIEKAQNPALKSPEYADWSGVDVLALDTRTVRFILSKPYAPFLGLTTLGILPSHLWEKIPDEQFPFSNLQTNPVGAGPFKVASVSRDSSGLIESVLLAANPQYVLGRPYLDTIRFNFYARTDDLASALASGAVESAYDLPVGKKTSRTITAPYARVFGVFWNPNEKPVYARAEVRKALSLAIDRDVVITTALGGSATPIMGPVPPGATSTDP